MKLSRLVRFISMIAMAVLLLTKAASAADIHVMISSGFHGAYSELGPAFERATGNHLITTRGPSMGDSPEAIPTRLARGESADVVILDGGAADELGKRGLVQADSKVELARSLIGMVVREGTEKPDISSVATFRNTLLSAKSIAYSDSGSGTYLSTVLFQKLGVADQIAAKSSQSRRTAVRRAGGRRGRARRSGNRLPAGRRAHSCSRHYLRRRAPNRNAADVHLRRRSDQDRASARGRPRPACISHLKRVGADDHEGWADASVGSVEGGVASGGNVTNFTP